MAISACPRRQGFLGEWQKCMQYDMTQRGAVGKTVLGNCIEGDQNIERPEHRRILIRLVGYILTKNQRG